jgi:hypothetical protein
MAVSYVCVWVGGGGDAKRLYGGGAKRFSAAFGGSRAQRFAASGFSGAAFRSIWVFWRSVSQDLGSRARANAKQKNGQHFRSALVKS